MIRKKVPRGDAVEVVETRSVVWSMGNLQGIRVHFPPVLIGKNLQTIQEKTHLLGSKLSLHYFLFLLLLRLLHYYRLFVILLQLEVSLNWMLMLTKRVL